MGGAKRPEDMTPTELFAQGEYGQDPAPSVADQFRDLVKKAGTGAKKGLGYDADAAQGITRSFQQYRDGQMSPFDQWANNATVALNPAASFGRDAASVVKYGPSTWLQKQTTAPAAPGAQPTPPEPPQPAADGGPPVDKGVNPNDLPNALTGPPTYRMGAGMGPGGDVYEGYGTEKGILHAQQDVLADTGHQQELKGDEYTARLKGMATHADLTHEVAAQKQFAAEAYKKAVDSEDVRQRDQETKIQQATDDTAAMGVDPGRSFRDRNVGFWINMAVGAVASGMLSALNGGQGQNPFMDSVRGMVQQDIAAQEKGIEQGWRRVKGMETAYERMRMSGADKVNSTQKAYDLHLEAIQTEIQSRMEKAEIPAQKAAYQQALQAVQVERDGIAFKMQEYWKNIRDTKARAAAAAAQAEYARRRQLALDASEMELKHSQAVKNVAEAQKLGRDSAKDDKTKENEARLYDTNLRYLRSPEVTSLFTGSKGDITSKAGVQHLPFGTDARGFQQKVDDYNANADTIIGHWLKDESGRVPVEEYREQAHRFRVTADMPSAERAARAKRLEQWVTERARTAGVAAPREDEQPGFGSGIGTFQKGP
jgi:hypothetical protein